MPYHLYQKTFNNKMSETELGEDVSVVDVYDIASDIGKECEKIIDHYGADAVTSLMPKVINALELLEALATRNERENNTYQELTSRIAQLENDKVEKAEYRDRFEKELEAIEEQWRGESEELVAEVSRLQDENRRLFKEKGSASTKDTEPAEASSDGHMLQRLRSLVDKQRDELRRKEHELQERNADVENLNLQVERLSSTCKEAKRKQRVLQTQVRSLCEERADFLAQLQDQHRELGALRKGLGLAQKENEDLVKSSDDDDPLRPRFTTAELKDILHERNELKTRVSDLEEELETYRPAPKVEELDDSPIDEDAPVQGPLPYEPDDAPWRKASESGTRKSESGIRKFFRKIFSEPGSAGFPRRSLSTLSKMALSAGPNTDIPV